MIILFNVDRRDRIYERKFQFAKPVTSIRNLKKQGWAKSMILGVKSKSFWEIENQNQVLGKVQNQNQFLAKDQNQNQLLSKTENQNYILKITKIKFKSI